MFSTSNVFKKSIWTICSCNFSLKTRYKLHCLNIFCSSNFVEDWLLFSSKQKSLIIIPDQSTETSKNFISTKSRAGIKVVGVWSISLFALLPSTGTRFCIHRIQATEGVTLTFEDLLLFIPHSATFHSSYKSSVYSKVPFSW